MDDVSTPDAEKSDDDDIAHPNYMSENEFTQSSSDDSVSDDNDCGATVFDTEHVTGTGELSDGKWRDDIDAIPDLNFDNSKFKFQTNPSVIF